VNESIRRAREVDVLKITKTETLAEEKWILQGRLVGPWVRELRTSWRKTHRTENSRKSVVDLNDVTFIDKGGERLLRAMSRQGVQFVAGGIYIRHVLEQLKTNRKSGLSRFIACLFAGFVATVFSFSPSRQANLGKLNRPQDTATRRSASYWSQGGAQRVPLFRNR
jgi:anti-anti-sigma regulatory factor